jgi:hypothetical protein
MDSFDHDSFDFDHDRVIDEHRKLIANLEGALEKYEFRTDSQAETNDVVISMANQQLARLRRQLARMLGEPCG